MAVLDPVKTGSTLPDVSQHSVGSYTTPVPKGNPDDQFLIDSLRQQYDTATNQVLKDAIHKEVSRLEAARGGVYNPSTGTYSFPNAQQVPSQGQALQQTLGYQPPSIPQAPNPFDGQVAGLLAQLSASINTPASNPYDSQVAALLETLTNRINNPAAPVDPRTTDQFTAGKAAIDRQVEDNIRMAQESLGASGFARSTNLANQAQSIAQSGTEFLETQLIPQIAQQLQAQDQMGLQNSMNLLQQLSQQQGVFDTRGQAQLQNLGALLGALTSQQGMFDNRQQNQFQNELGLSQLDISGQQLNIQKQTQKFNEDQAKIRNELEQLQSALQRTQNFGSVSKADAKIIGVPAGTPTFEAQNAVAEREQRLTILDRQIEADRANTLAQIGASNARAAESNTLAKTNQLLQVWQSTGTAPKGLEGLGVTAGTQYNPMLSPGQQVDQKKLDQMLKDEEAQAQSSAQINKIQSTYGVGQTMAGAVASAMDNPTLQSAMSDIEANKVDLERKLGINVKQLKDIVTKEFNAMNPQISPSSGNTSSGSFSSTLGSNPGMPGLKLYDLLFGGGR